MFEKYYPLAPFGRTGVPRARHPALRGCSAFIVGGYYVIMFEKYYVIMFEKYLCIS